MTPAERAVLDAAKAWRTADAALDIGDAASLAAHTAAGDGLRRALAALDAEPPAPRVTAGEVVGRWVALQGGLDGVAPVIPWSDAERALVEAWVEAVRSLGLLVRRMSEGPGSQSFVDYALAQHALDVAALRRLETEPTP